MAECQCLLQCPFFNDKMANMPGTASVFKNKYCKNKYDQCARFQVFQALGPGKSPGDLFPNQVERVPGIIKQFK
jgi:hypothetical protein